MKVPEGPEAIEPLGTEVNLYHEIRTKVAEAAKEKKTDPPPVAGGGLATDVMKPTVALAGPEGDLRDTSLKGGETKNVSFPGMASIPVVIGLETNECLATLCALIREKSNPVSLSAPLKPLASDLEAIHLSFVC